MLGDLVQRREGVRESKLELFLHKGTGVDLNILCMLLRCVVRYGTSRKKDKLYIISKEENNWHSNSCHGNLELISGGDVLSNNELAKEHDGVTGLADLLDLSFTGKRERVSE